ncbi:Sporulation domain-containing protein [Gemmatirosa kalamazoonensis]|uniref:Sporulation domain-containing protein n=1 Tax=Gemmatirosa kalamazoonensis TaxID=861299 RepID=W0RH84_9BACT|nr:Sporulation domain-containing protein [Gemmatirosa kalamazoonensis]
MLAACGSDRRSATTDTGAASSAARRGPDAVLLRVPRAGGRVSAYVYPKLDSAVWRSSEAAPALDHVLAFDGESGLLAAVDARGIPVRVDLRLGTVRQANKTPLASLASLNGVDIFGVAPPNDVTRLTPSGESWAVKLPAPVQAIEPQRDGGILVAARRGSAGIVWRLRPPGTRITDSVVVEHADQAISARTPERVFFQAGRDLGGVQSRTLQPLQVVRFDAPVRAIAATPSGDRFYVALQDQPALKVLDRYSNSVAGTVELPGTPSELRMDPLGRYVLARAARGDSSWVVAVGTDKVVGTVRTAWRTDLPLVLPDGAILTVVGDDAVLVDGQSLKQLRKIDGGGADLWHLVVWNGFRPRAAGLDKPVEFQSEAPVDSAPTDTAAATDSTAPHPDTTAHAPDTTHAPRPIVPQAEAAETTAKGFTVQFAAARTESEAKATLRRLKLPRDIAARIIPSTRRGRLVYRVVVGPFATRAQAERIGRATGHDYWLYEGAP